MHIDPSLVIDAAARAARIEAKVDLLLEQKADHEARVRALEAEKTMARGAFVALAGLTSWLGVDKVLALLHRLG